MADEFVGDVTESSPATESEAVPVSSQTETFSWESVINAPAEVSEPVETAQESEAEEEAETSEQTAESEPETAKKSRSENFRTLKEEKTVLQTQLSEKEAEIEKFNQRLSEIDTTLEAYGGVEGIQTFIDNQAIWLDPAKYKEAAEFIEGLPHASAIRSSILQQTFGLGVELSAEAQAIAEQNRLTYLNQSLKQEYGLATNLPPEIIDLAMNWLSQRANSDLNQLKEDLTDEISFLVPQTPEQKRIAELEAKLNGNEKTEKEKQPETYEEIVKQYEENSTKISQIFNQYDNEVLTKVSAEVLKDFDTSFEKLPEIDRETLKAYLLNRAGSSPTFVQLAEWLVSGKADHPNAKFLKTQYENLVRTNFRAWANRYLGKPKTSVNPSPNPKPQTQVQPQNTESIAPVSTPKKEGNTWANWRSGV